MPSCFEPDCKSPDAEISIDASITGGPYIAAFHPKLLKVSGLVSAKAGATVEFKCLKWPEEEPEVCFKEIALIGRATLFGGLSYDIKHTWEFQDVCL